MINNLKILAKIRKKQSLYQDNILFQQLKDNLCLHTLPYNGVGMPFSNLI